jgi:MerR family transcriptional regulator, copper efflux regulator
VTTAGVDDGLDLQVDSKVYPAAMTTGYRIAEVARRSGFPAATLRYYEGIGLLPQAARSDAGYRLYDQNALDRLAFIARAKQLGCTLDEIAELSVAWDGGECAPVQDRLRELVDVKLNDARARIVELVTLTAELQAAAASLERHRPSGGCDDNCGCISASDVGAAHATEARTSASVSLIAKPTRLAVTRVEEAPTIACTLDGAAMGTRLAEWQALLAVATARVAGADGVRVEFAADAPVAEIARLAAAEQGCCSFFSFAITVDERGVGLEVQAPDDARPVIDALFGASS